jgi:electron transport complex protein RnfD
MTGVDPQAQVNERPLVLLTAPQLVSPMTTQVIMRDVLIALAPTMAAAGILFGLRALLVCAVAVVSCVGMEWLWCRLRGIPNTANDLSAAVTGLLLAFNVPSTLPLYMVVIGAFVAIIMTKELFGGIGKNFANPAIVGRIFLAVAFPAAMTNFVAANQVFPLNLAPDLVSSATPLSPNAAPATLMELFLGQHAGVLGETSAVALLLGMLFLLYRPVITWHIPTAYVGTVAILSLLTGHDVLAQLCSGGLMLGAWFMATDYTTSPATTRGKLIFGVGCGVIVYCIRRFSAMAEGVSYAILFMNLFVPLIDRYVRPGRRGRKDA